MPSTNLPLTGALRDGAGFKWQPGGSTSVAEAVHALNWPAELIPGGGAQFNTNKFRRSVESLDKDQRETWTIGSGREEATLRVRFDGWPESLLDMMEDAADGVEVDYYPRLASTNLSFPVKLLDANARISEDEDRFSHAEYEADLRVRDASTDRQGFWWLKGPNKLKNPRLSQGTTDGVAEEWTVGSGGVGRVSIDGPSRSQKLAMSSTSGATITVEQTVHGALAGDQWAVSVEADVSLLSSTAVFGRIELRELTSTGQVAESAQNFPRPWQNDTDFTTITVTSTAFRSNATRVLISLEVRDSSTDGSGTGSVRYRDAKLTIS